MFTFVSNELYQMVSCINWYCIMRRVSNGRVSKEIVSSYRSRNNKRDNSSDPHIRHAKYGQDWEAVVKLEQGDRASDNQEGHHSIDTRKDETSHIVIE